MMHHSHRVRSYEVDHQGYLFNGRYLEIADAAMAEFFRFLGFGYNRLIELGFDPAVVASDLRFSSPGKLDDDLQIAVDMEHLGTSSIRLRLDFSHDNEPIAVILTTYVNVDTKTNASRPIPELIRAALSALPG